MRVRSSNSPELNSKTLRPNLPKGEGHTEGHTVANIPNIDILKVWSNHTFKMSL